MEETIPLMSGASERDLWAGVQRLAGRTLQTLHGKPFDAEMSLRLNRRAVFDARAFVLPTEEVANYFIWRQQDATRNSVSMAAHAELARKLGVKQAQTLLHGKTWGEQQELLFAHCGINWGQYPTHLKRGACVAPG